MSVELVKFESFLMWIVKFRTR